MRVVNTHSNTTMFNHQQQESIRKPAGSIQKKKPLPRIPQYHQRHSTPVASTLSGGYVVPGPSWMTTMNLHSNNENEYLLAESPQPMEGYADQSLLLTQAPQSSFYYGYYSHQNYPLQPSAATSTTNNNQEWKTSTSKMKKVNRSDSLKIEASMPVPFLKNGQLPLETHFEKPYEPDTEEILQEQQKKALMLQRKISKEEVYTFEAPTSLLLQKLNESSVSYRKQHKGGEEDLKITAEACAHITATFLTPKSHESSSTEFLGSSSGGSSMSVPHSSVSSFSEQPSSSLTVETDLSKLKPTLNGRVQRHCISMPMLTAGPGFEPQEEGREEEDPSFSFSATEKYFDQPASASSVSTPRIPSPWGTSASRRSQSERRAISRISTGSIPNMTIYTAQAPDAVSRCDSTLATTTVHAVGANVNVAEQYAQASTLDVHLQPTPSKYSLSIASCSLINIRANIKLYRRMAIKTRNNETQMTYAKYLLQISKLYDKNSTQPSSSSLMIPSTSSDSNNATNDNSARDMKLKHVQETPAQTRHRLLSEAGYWIERLAKAGKPEALFIKGRWYLLGPEADDCVLRGYEKVQEAKAFKCFLRSSNAGWTESHYELANLWKKRGNYTKAIQCYEKGAKEQHTPSIYKMAKILLRGQLKKKKDLTKGMDYLKQAADMNDPACAEPAFVLGCIYANEFDRIGIQKYVDKEKKTSISNVKEKVNYSQALKYLKKSAHHGYPDAIYFMGQVSEKGMLGQLCDSWQAYQHYMKAADVNHAGAMLDLSRIYSEGISGLLAAQKDLAFKWCKRSADLGFDQAEYVLGKYYENGIGIAPDFARALEYFGKAASKGYQPAAEKLNRPMADGSHRRRTVKKDNQKKFVPVVIALPKVKQDDDDDEDPNDTHKPKASTSTSNNICTIQ